jgi:hypothetical protein
MLNDDKTDSAMGEMPISHRKTEEGNSKFVGHTLRIEDYPNAIFDNISITYKENPLSRPAAYSLTTLLKELKFGRPAKDQVFLHRVIDVLEGNIDIPFLTGDPDSESKINVTESTPDYKEKYEKCIEVIKRFDPGIIGMYDL